MLRISLLVQAGFQRLSPYHQGLLLFHYTDAKNRNSMTSIAAFELPVRGLDGTLHMIEVLPSTQMADVLRMLSGDVILAVIFVTPWAGQPPWQ
jgi:hypothetical protein